ncbi:hypothetical protein [Vallitalea sp.]|jgi:hypothetical protein|uniref:hypothetical protein n=1 Tax=Vallitalea sp. TaxID=1882829 RepID=UPI0025FE8BA6|nr:hypothetical protein [Vallitalea sp.]MCT4688906.1 hypothetical protein [Vallitalea sp.]
MVAIQQSAIDFVALHLQSSVGKSVYIGAILGAYTDYCKTNKLTKETPMILLYYITTVHGQYDNLVLVNKWTLERNVIEVWFDVELV